MSSIRADRETSYLLPPSVDEWLPANHPARFTLEVIEQLDLSRLAQGYARRGSAALLALLVYGHATGVFSSRKIERATFAAVAFRPITNSRASRYRTPWRPFRTPGAGSTAP